MLSAAQVPLEHGVCTQGAAFEKHAGAAVAVARFAHTYDVPHALRHVEDYLSAFMEKHVPRVGVTYTRRFG